MAEGKPENARVYSATPPMIGDSSSSSDNTNPEEICPNSYCLCPPFEVLRKPLRPQRTSPILLPTWPPPIGRQPLSLRPYSCRMHVLPVLIGHMLACSASDGRGKTCLCSLFISQVGRRPLLYVKATSPLSFRLPGVKVSAFPLMKSI